MEGEGMGQISKTERQSAERCRASYRDGVSGETEVQVEKLIVKYFANYLQGMNLTVGYCQAKGQPSIEIKPGLIGAILLLTTLLAIIAASTILHLPPLKSFLKSSPMLTNLAHNLHHFDLIQNLQVLLEFKSQENPKIETQFDTRFITGLKVHILFVVCMVHGFLYLTLAFSTTFSPLRHFPSRALAMFSLPIVGDFWEKGPMMICIFFIISGFLHAFNLLHKGRNLPPTFSTYIIRRWLLFLAPVIGTLCLTIIFQHLGTSPLMHYSLTDPYVAACHIHWLRHLLFLQNWFPLGDMCGLNLWFIGALLQLYVILYLVVFLYYRKKMLAYASAIILATLGPALLIFIALAGWTGFPLIKSLSDFKFPLPLDSLTVVYMMPISHLFSYFGGVLVALLWLNNCFSIKIKPFANLLWSLLWSLTVLLLISLPLPASLRSEANDQYGLPHNGLILLIYLAVVATNVAMFIILLQSSSNSLTKQLLSHPIWKPLSRLSLSIYLVNSLVIWYSFHIMGDIPTLSLINSIKFGFTSYLGSVALGLVLYLLFECPFTSIVNEVFRGRDDRHTESSDIAH